MRISRSTCAAQAPLPAQVKQRRASRVSGSDTNAHSEGGGIINCHILREPDEDSPADLLADVHQPSVPDGDAVTIGFREPMGWVQLQ